MTSISETWKDNIWTWKPVCGNGEEKYRKAHPGRKKKIWKKWSKTNEIAHWIWITNIINRRLLSFVTRLLRHTRNITVLIETITYALRLARFRLARPEFRYTIVPQFSTTTPQCCSSSESRASSCPFTGGGSATGALYPQTVDAEGTSDCASTCNGSIGRGRMTGKRSAQHSKEWTGTAGCDCGAERMGVNMWNETKKEKKLHRDQMTPHVRASHVV